MNEATFTSLVLTLILVIMLIFLAWRSPRPVGLRGALSEDRPRFTATNLQIRFGEDDEWIDFGGGPFRLTQIDISKTKTKIEPIVTELVFEEFTEAEWDRWLELLGLGDEDDADRL